MRASPGILLLAVASLTAGCASTPQAVAFQSAEMVQGRAQVDRQVVVRAFLEMEVQDPAVAADEVTRIVTESDGLVESSTADGASVRLMVRVPADELDRVMDTLGRLGEVQRQSVATTDVTDQIGDLDARLTNLLAVRDRLRGYLERAEDLEDVVAVERELTRVQTEIDSLTGRLERLRDQVAMSQLAVTLDRRTVLGPLGLVVSGTAWLLGKLFIIR